LLQSTITAVAAAAVAVVTQVTLNSSIDALLDSIALPQVRAALHVRGYDEET
jgi:hypothetical protein